MHMALWEIFLIAAGLSLDVFAFALWRGAMHPTLDRLDVLKMLLIFTAFQAGAMLAGNLITFIPFFRENIRRANMSWVVAAAMIFFGLGTYMVVKGLHKNKTEIIEEHKEETFDYRLIRFWALLTSIDSLLAGISFGFLSVELFAAVIMTAITTAVACLLGLILGYRLGCTPKNKLISIGGAVVIVGAIDILTHYFFWG